MSDPLELGAAGARVALERGELSSVELVGAVLERADRTEPTLHAYAHLDGERAMRDAEEADRRRRTGDRLALLGIPVAVKDLVWTSTEPTTAGSRVLAGWIAPEDATLVRRLRDAGAIIVGKTVTHEFGTSQDEPPTRNAWDATRQPGGSSAGSGTAVAAGSAIVAIGTDSGGSTRKPAVFNGVVGLKPTYGRVSRHGVIYPGSSMDQAGPIGRTVEDAALVFDVINGHDPRDPSSIPVLAAVTSDGLDRAPSGRLGVPTEVDDDGVAPDVRAALLAAYAELETAGFELVPVRIPALAEAAAAGYTILMVEQASFHRTWLTTPQSLDYQPETRWLLAAGSLIPATHYQAANRLRRRLIEQVRDVFDDNGLLGLVGPTVRAVASAVGSVANPTYVPNAVRFTVPWNLTGLPAISVPCGVGDGGMPVGLQFVGRPFDEPTVLRIADAYEQRTDWHRRRPTV